MLLHLTERRTERADSKPNPLQRTTRIFLNGGQLSLVYSANGLSLSFPSDSKTYPAWWEISIVIDVKHTLLIEMMFLYLTMVNSNLGLVRVTMVQEASDILTGCYFQGN